MNLEVSVWTCLIVLLMGYLRWFFMISGFENHYRQIWIYKNLRAWFFWGLKPFLFLSLFKAGYFLWGRSSMMCLNIDTTLNNLTINLSIQETKDDRVESLILKQIRPEAEDDSAFGSAVQPAFQRISNFFFFFLLKLSAVCTFWIVLICWYQKWFLKNKKTSLACISARKAI